jgi:hypothetical protein
MKSTCFLLILLSFSFTSFSQNPLEEIYVDEVLQPVDSTEAVYVRHFNEVSTTRIECEVFSAQTGAIRMTGTYASMGEELIENGHFIFYHDVDQIESEGFFILGFKSGVWKRYSPDGKTLPEKYYDPEAADILRRLNKVGLK